MFCPQCGAEAQDGDAFCGICGGDLSQAGAPALVQPPTPVAPATQPTAPLPPQPTAPLPAQPAAATPVMSGAAEYSKAPSGGRLGAVIIDSIVASALLPLGALLVYAAAAKGGASAIGYALLGLGVLWQLAYMLGRDAFGGAGVGKRLTGLVVTSVATGAPAGFGPNFVRQLVFYALNAIPIGGLIEPIMVLADKGGRRLGDKLAKTQVVRVTEASARGLVSARRKGGAVAVAVASVLVMIVGSAVGGFVFYRAASGVIETPVVETPPTTEPIDTTQEEATPSTTPEQVVDAFYAAVGSGDLTAIQATLVSGFAEGITPDMFEGWTNPSYRVLTVDTEREPGSVYVEVQEADGGLSNGLVTFKLVQESGEWRITSWSLGGIDEAAEASGAESDPSTGGGQEGAANVDPLNKENAVDLVGVVLAARKNNDVATLKANTSSALKKNDPGFYADASEALIDFEIKDVFRDGGTFIVVTWEDWISGPEDGTQYVCVVENGKLVVDAQIFPE